MDLSAFDLLIVENVGNLVCPISFKLGTHQNILIASIPEGTINPINIQRCTREWMQRLENRPTSICEL